MCSKTKPLRSPKLYLVWLWCSYSYVILLYFTTFLLKLFLYYFFSLHLHIDVCSMYVHFVLITFLLALLCHPVYDRVYRLNNVLRHFFPHTQFYLRDIVRIQTQRYALSYYQNRLESNLQLSHLKWDVVLRAVFISSYKF